MKYSWALLLLFLPAAGAQQQVGGHRCIIRETDKDSYRLEPLRLSEIADRNAIAEEGRKNVDLLIKSAKMDSQGYRDYQEDSDRIDKEADRLALSILEAHDITFSPDDKAKNYGTFLLPPGGSLFGLDADKKFASVQMMGNFLLISNFTEEPCGKFDGNSMEMDQFMFNKEWMR